MRDRILEVAALYRLADLLLKLPRERERRGRENKRGRDIKYLPGFWVTGGL